MIFLLRDYLQFFFYTIKICDFVKITYVFEWKPSARADFTMIYFADVSLWEQGGWTIKMRRIITHLLGEYPLPSNRIRQKDSLWYSGNTKEITAQIINFRLSDGPIFLVSVILLYRTSSILGADANARDRRVDPGAHWYEIETAITVCGIGCCFIVRLRSSVHFHGQN